MSVQRHIQLVVAAILTSTLVSCIDVHEEIWLNPDGSGRMDLAYTIPASAAKLQGGEAGIHQMIDSFLDRTHQIHCSRCDITSDAERLTIRFQGSFESALDLLNPSIRKSFEKLPPTASSLIGRIDVQRSGWGLDFSRTIYPNKALPGAIFLPSSQVRGRNLTYIMHLPVGVSETNATHVSNAGRTLVWSYSLSQALQKPIIHHFKASIPIPWKWIATAAVILTTSWLLLRKFWSRRASITDE
jgi:hypothetical protein